MRPIMTGVLAMAFSFGLTSLLFAQVADFGLDPPTKDTRKAEYAARLFVAQGTNEGVLEFEVKLPEGWITPPVEGSKEQSLLSGPPTRIRIDKPKKKITKPKEIEVAGPWVPNSKPIQTLYTGEDFFFHDGKVIWRSRVKLAKGADPSKLKFNLYYDAVIHQGRGGISKLAAGEVPVIFAGAIAKEELTLLPTFQKTKEEPRGIPRAR
jgi:hypothetical protein